MEKLRRIGTIVMRKHSLGDIGVIQRIVLAILLLSLGLLVQLILTAPGGSESLSLSGLAAVSLALLGWRWLRWSRGGRWHYADLALESVGIVLTSVAVGDAFPTLGIIYTGFYFRPLVGTLRFSVIGALTSCSALFTGAYFAGHETHTLLSADLLGQIPMLAMTAVLGYVVSYVLQRQQRLTVDLTEAEQRYRSLVEQLPEVVFTASMEGVITYMSPQTVDLLGMPAGLLVGLSLEEFEHYVDPMDRAGFREARVATIADRTPFQIEYRLQAPERGLLWVRAQGQPIRGHEGEYTHWLGTLSDITERKGMEEQLAFQAFHDNLTGLPNRTLFRDRLEHAIARSARSESPLAVLFLDLDNFKIVNDSLGHQVGDELIQAISCRLTSAVRDGDTIGRIGGDEFLILLEDLESEQEALIVTDRIFEALSSELQLQEHSLSVSTSIGIVYTHGSHMVADDIIRHADTAMYAAKRRGRSQYAMYEQEMGDEALERLNIETELRRALQENELIVHFQPIVDLQSGKISEVEGLVRWNHPVRGLLPPGAFLNVAEDTGLIRAIDLWVLRESCKQVRQWQQSNPEHADLVASVNLSALQLREATLSEQVAAILAETGLAARHLKLEITEHAMLADVQQAKDALLRLGALGVRLAIDDFGTGNSALNYLREFPINTLKIDRSFVTGLRQGHGDADMVRALITLAQSLGLDVTAEGIEGDEYVDLRRFGCNHGQGYYFARPQDARAFEDLLRQPNLNFDPSALFADIAAG